jgi:hypothetical protein
MEKLNNLIQVSSPNMAVFELFLVSWEIMLSIVIGDEKNELRIFKLENIYEPVIRVYIFWVVIVG